MKEEKLILVTNDDGYDSKGLAAAVEVARAFGRVVVVAPETTQSGMSQAITMYNPLYLRCVSRQEGLEVYAFSGTPVDCVKMAFDYLLRDQRVDLFISNYVYEKVYEGTHTAIGYKFALPRKKIFSWDQIGHFRPDQNLLMHSLCYRTDVLRESNLPMPAHTFYVDNIYAYVPLPRCKTMYYADIDLYRYFIGREGQSVNEATMVKRLGQQFRVTRIMMESFHLYQDVESSRLRSYMMGYFTMMMAICSVLTKLSEEDCADERLKTLWKDLKEYDERMYRRARYGVVGFFTNLRGRAGDKTTLGLYHLASKIFKFN